MGRTAVIVSRRQQHCHGGSIDVRTGVGNFLRGVTPNQDILTVASGDNDGGSGEVVMESWVAGRKTSVFRGSGFRSLLLHP